jgi:carbamate kinase
VRLKKSIACSDGVLGWWLAIDLTNQVNSEEAENL